MLYKFITLTYKVFDILDIKYDDEQKFIIDKPKVIGITTKSKSSIKAKMELIVKKYTPLELSISEFLVDEWGNTPYGKTFHRKKYPTNIYIDFIKKVFYNNIKEHIATDYFSLLYLHNLEDSSNLIDELLNYSDEEFKLYISLL